MRPPAPVRFSTMNAAPVFLPIVRAMVRATMSPVPPTAKGTMILTGLLGYSAATASELAASRSASKSRGARKAPMSFMTSSSLLLHSRHDDSVPFGIVPATAASRKLQLVIPNIVGERQPREVRGGERRSGHEPKLLDHELQLSRVLCRMPNGALQGLVQRLFAVVDIGVRGHVRAGTATFPPGVESLLHIRTEANELLAEP